MGWISGVLEEPFSAEAALRFEFSTTSVRETIADCAMVKMRDPYLDYTHVVYAAYRGDAPNEVSALVLLVHCPGQSMGSTITTKVVSESMGPNEDECPLRILDLLTPTDKEYAIKWRERCRENAGLGAGATS